MAKVLVSKFAVEFTFDELFMVRVLLKSKVDELNIGEKYVQERLAHERLYDELNIDKFR